MKEFLKGLSKGKFVITYFSSRTKKAFSCIFSVFRGSSFSERSRKFFNQEYTFASHIFCSSAEWRMWKLSLFLFLIFSSFKAIVLKVISYYWNYVASSHVYFLQWLTYYISLSFGITISFLNFNFLVALDQFINMLNHSSYWSNQNFVYENTLC